MRDLLKEWRLYAVLAMAVLFSLQLGAMLSFYGNVPAYSEDGADALPLLVAAAAYPGSGEACHAAAAAEIMGIADHIQSNTDASDGDDYRHSMAWHGDASLAKEAYYDEVEERGVTLVGYGSFTNMEVAVDAWLDGADGNGPATPGC